MNVDHNNQRVFEGLPSNPHTPRSPQNGRAVVARTPVLQTQCGSVRLLLSVFLLCCSTDVPLAAQHTPLPLPSDSESTNSQPVYESHWQDLLGTSSEPSAVVPYWYRMPGSPTLGSLFSLTDPQTTGRVTSAARQSASADSGSTATGTAGRPHTLSFSARSASQQARLHDGVSGQTTEAGGTAGNVTLLSEGGQARTRSAAETRVILRGRQDPPRPGGSTDETQSSSEKPALLTVVEIETRKAAAAELPDLSEEDQAAIARHYQRAIENIAQRLEADQLTAEYKADRDLAPEQSASLRQLAGNPPPDSAPEIAADATSAEVEQIVLQMEEQISLQNERMTAWTERSRMRSERRPLMPMLIEDARQKLTEAETALKAIPPEGEMPALTAARRTEIQTGVELLRSTVELYRVEQQRFEARSELLPLERDQITRDLNLAQQRLEQSRAALAEARRRENQRQAEEARLKLQNSFPQLRQLAEDNAAVVARSKELQELTQLKTPEYESLQKQLKKLEEEFHDLQERERHLGQTAALGQELLDEREELTDVSVFLRRRLRTIEENLTLRSDQQVWQKERNALADLEAEIQRRLAELSREGGDPEELEAGTRELLTDRRDYLTTVLADCDKHSQLLGKMELSLELLENLTEEIDSWISERILWIRSTDVISPATLQVGLISLWALVSSSEWSTLLLELVADLNTNPVVWLFCGTVILLLFVLQKKAQTWINNFATVNSRRLDAGIPLTLLATIITIFRAVAWPSLLLFIAWRLSLSELVLATAISHAAAVIALMLWVVETSRMLCRSSGVAVLFIGWKPEVARSLRNNLTLLISVGLPLLFLVILFRELDDDLHVSLGRLLLAGYCLLLSLIVRRLFSPSGNAFRELLLENLESLLQRLRWFWYVPAVAAPAALALLSLLGYQYTAEQLLARLELNLAMAFVFAFAYSMVMQWVLAARRNLVMSQNRARRAAMLAAQEAAGAGDEAAGTLPTVEVPQLDISLINQQMLRMVRGVVGFLFMTVCWLTWSEVLPALQVVNRVELWNTVTTVTEQQVGPNGVVTPQQITRIEAVSLGDLLLAVVLMAVSIIAGRNLPGLLELAVLQRLPFDHGGRHAITTLCRYAILLGGFIAAFNTLGIEWDNVQWLVGALMVGLGFGMQEIFANFISGLIILFERPVRIGDLVTIDGVEGCVSRINIRATTITDWNRREYIVPNRELVTGKVLNWTLTDKVNRVVVNVGVAYGSDLQLALQQLRDAADSHPLLLTDPAPIISFEEFGDSTLNLVLRCYLPNYDNRLKVITELHLDIDRRFRESNLEISFPQRDLHIRSLPPEFMQAQFRSAS